MTYNLSNDVVGVSRAPYRAALVSAPSSLKHGKQAAGVSEILGGMGFRASAGVIAAFAKDAKAAYHGELEEYKYVAPASSCCYRTDMYLIVAHLHTATDRVMSHPWRPLCATV